MMETTLKGPYGHTVLRPTQYPYIIGRNPNNQVVVNDPRVITHIAVIRPERQGYIITDLGSSEGTFVNELRLIPNVPRLLQAGDLIRIGDTRYVFEAADIPQSPAESTVYGGSIQESNPSPPYPPMVATPPPPYTGESSGWQHGGYTPASPVLRRKPSRRGLWISLGAIVGVLLIGVIVLGAFAYVNRSTPTKTLNAFSGC